MENAAEFNMYTHMESYSTRLSPNTVGFLMKRAEIMKVKPGQILCQEGERSDFVFIVIHGSASVEKIDYLGNKAIIAEVDTGALIGEMGVFLNMKRSATIVAATEMTLLKFTNENFINSLPHTPDLTVRLLKTLADKVNEVNGKYSNLIVGNTVLTVGLYILDTLADFSTRYESVVLNLHEIIQDTKLDYNRIMAALNSFLKQKIITQWAYVESGTLTFKAHIPELKAYMKQIAG